MLVDWVVGLCLSGSHVEVGEVGEVVVGRSRKVGPSVDPSVRRCGVWCVVCGSVVWWSCGVVWAWGEEEEKRRRGGEEEWGRGRGGSGRMRVRARVWRGCWCVVGSWA